MQTSLVGAVRTTGCQITAAIKSQGRRDGKQPGYFSARVSLFAVLKTSFGRNPEPQAKREHGHGGDAAEPKGREPQQPLPQRPRFLCRRLQ
jgi:hypothetical protein